MSLLRQLHSLLDRRERRLVVLLLLAMIVKAAVELVGVASIAPFMSVVADPDIIQRNDVLRRLFEAGGFETSAGFLSTLGIAAIALLALSNAVSAATQWVTLRFVWGTHHRLALRMMKGYLAQPYAFFVQRNSAKLHKNILAEVSSAVNGVLQPTMTFAAGSLVALAIVGLLVAIDPVLALLVVVTLGGAYGAIYLIVRRKQARLGRDRVRANQERFKVASEAFGGIKDVKMLHREAAFVDRFAPASDALSRTMASNGTISVVPRYLLETIAFGGILLIVVVYLQAGSGLSRILPTITLYAFAGYRLMPALQQLFSAAATVRFKRAALEELLEDLECFVPGPKETDGRDPLPLTREIRVESLTFSYPGTSRPALDAISLTIPRNATIGLVGPSGAGKTTLVDLLLGFYTPEMGHIEVDDVRLDSSNVRRWQQQVGYVPQHIFLCDDSISANISFGMRDDEVDPARVERAARIAHLHHFIETLPDGYDTTVGERGVRISGGQRQRIGIARALYHDPQVLMLDEATSALDGATEDAVMEAIRELAGQKTIVLIAHRLSTVQDCDCIYLLEKGRVVDRGTYVELATGSSSFQAMAKLEPNGGALV
jgi:ABC-type multidrug transport system fused ATPase/permease subunit